MKKVLTRTLLTAAVTATISISAQAADRIGVTIYKYDDNFMSIMRKALEQTAEDDGSLELLMNDSQNNQSMQNDQVDIMLAKGVKGLAINLVDPAAGGTIITKAKGADIPVVFFNKDPGQAAIDSYDKAYFVGTDPVQSGVIQGELIAKSWQENPDWDLNGDGKIQYALLKGEPGHPDAEARTEWVIKTLNEQGIETDELYLDAALWDTAKAKDMAQAWLSGPNADKIEMIIANNDAMAMGANEAAKSQDRKLPIFGVDALPEALQLIKRGEITGTVLNDAQGQAQAIYDITANLAAGKDAVDGTDYELDNHYLRVPYVGVDENNLDEFLSN